MSMLASFSLFHNYFLMSGNKFNKNYEHSVNVADLSFTYGGPPIIDHLDLQLDAGNRCILVGANGAGKTTLLRILAGKRMIHGAIKVLGQDAFLDAPQVSPCCVVWHVDREAHGECNRASLTWVQNGQTTQLSSLISRSNICSRAWAAIAGLSALSCS